MIIDHRFERAVIIVFVLAVWLMSMIVVAQNNQKITTLTEDKVKFEKMAAKAINSHVEISNEMKVSRKIANITFQRFKVEQRQLDERIDSLREEMTTEIDQLRKIDREPKPEPEKKFLGLW